MKFKVGDKVRGTSDSYFYTDKNMSLGEVVNVTPFEIEIKIIEHSDRSQVGKVYWAALPKGKFELVEEKKMDKLEELETKIKELSDEIEKLKAEEESKEWKPKHGDYYWFVDSDGVIHKTEWNTFGIHRRRYLIGNVFKTEEEAEFRVGQLKVEAELRRFARPFKIGGKNYTLQHWGKGDKIDITFFEAVQCGNIYFPSEEIAQRAIDTVGADRIKKYYFGVED
ncbi:hypothetical protein [Globicatella sp. PHS-GS-PNBC-21-1553]|uniref:hypothetical protein n=1 Tax=Globicatella sp. PHS-GS-PNBC-21-1553 TaxID=2885764 RepID=UPI00298EE5E8|nr:hypothetical protein [Globicatella sp. PHS-GS-PNBC-21-1553]WPC07988.1 hypothetical protein LB888_07990 [Globicatella sp. PHS-GS-PNBC-21-1553]